MLTQAPIILTVAGIAAWGGALLSSELPAYSDQQARFLALTLLGGALFAAAAGMALWRAL